MRTIGRCLATFLLVGAPACSSEGESAQPVDATISTVSVITATGAVDVTLEDVRYDCGPTDATVIKFRVSATAPLSGTAHLLVLGDIYGTAEIEIGTTSDDYLMGIELSQDAYDEALGEVRITSEDGAVVAAEPVTLRLAAGAGCG